MKSSLAEIARILAALEGTPRCLLELTAGLDDEALHSPPGEKSWSVAEILAHLRACADNWTYSIYAMLAENSPALPDVNERKWARVTGYSALRFSRSLQTFTLQREELLRVPTALPPEAWERPAMIFGRRHTVFTQARRMAKHEAEHCAQIGSILD